MHNAKVIAIKDLNDENIAYLVRCCDSSNTDSWITLSVHLSDQEHDASLQTHQDRVADTHSKKVIRLAKAHEILNNVS